MKSQNIEGFSKLTREQKIKVLEEIAKESNTDFHLLQQCWFSEDASSLNMASVSENVVSNFVLPYSIAPNFNINGKLYLVPMVTEESSVVAAAASAAKFWLNRGGFTARVLSTLKVGQIHFMWTGKYEHLTAHFQLLEKELKDSVSFYLFNMEKRGGGIRRIELIDFTSQLPDYYQLRVSFTTADAMGANLINTCLEEIAKTLRFYIRENFEGKDSKCDVIMAILSNYTPDCLVECSVKCKVDDFKGMAEGMTPNEFVERFRYAVTFADVDIYRAVTHNKGIFNGIDAVILATGNDFRAVEAGGHSYAVRDGRYRSLTHIEIKDNNFVYTLRIPLSIGTKGGVTSIHPFAKISLEILGNPAAMELMTIAAAVGLANNFSAIRALITSGIQKGHMKIHLNNILHSLKATESERKAAIDYFNGRSVSFEAVQKYLDDLRR